MTTDRWFAGMITCAACNCTFWPSETTKHPTEGVDICPNCGEISDVFPSDDGNWNRDGRPDDDGTHDFWRWNRRKRPKRRVAS